MPRTIGILGGMSPESTVEYYLHIIHSYTETHKDHNYPEIIIYSVSFEPYIHWPEEKRWDLVAKGLGEAAKKLEDAGAELIIMATNTMHKVYDEIQAAVGVPILNLLDAVADAVNAKKLSIVGLLGTRFTMESSFYYDTLRKKGITVISPALKDIEYVNRIIYDELIEGKIRAASRTGFVGVINRLRKRGAQGVILGCTEIPLLVSDDDVNLPLFDTSVIHAEAALKAAFQNAPVTIATEQTVVKQKSSFNIRKSTDHDPTVGWG